MIQAREEDVLNPVFRKKVIDEIGSPYNRSRKAEAFKRYECFKDKTSKYVTELLLAQFDASTVYEMQYAITNISFVRKVIGKLARVYSNGALRTTELDTTTDTVQDLANHLAMNTVMKKTNRFFKLQKNLVVYVKPVKVDGRIDLCIKPMNPFLYDVISENENEREAMCVITSDYSPDRGVLYAQDAASANRTSHPNVRSLVPTESKPDTVIAQPGHEDANDYKNKRFIWWTKNYHFTTDGIGNIVAAEGYELGDDGSIAIDNPIKQLPFIVLADDPDDGFYADGGEDLADAGIKINAMLSNINHIAITQGYGQPFMTGKNLPRTVKLGPNSCILGEYNEGEPKTEFSFLTANPPLNDLKLNMEMYIALLLSTNNLSISSVASQLSGGNSFASGIALIIDKAESVEDVEDQSQLFRDKEPKIWELAFKWMEYLQRVAKADLVDELQQAFVPVETKVKVSFPPSQPILSEKEKLEVLEKRKDLGINTMVELVMKDDPSLDQEGAKKKLAEIMEESMQRMAQSMMMNPMGEDKESQPETNQPVENKEEDELRVENKDEDEQA